jgi:hypothetical protein
VYDALTLDLPEAIRLALYESKLRLDDVDAIAYTRGPGMHGCLSVCAASAKALTAASGKPLIGVHHMVSVSMPASKQSPLPSPFLLSTIPSRRMAGHVGDAAAAADALHSKLTRSPRCSPKSIRRSSLSSSFSFLEVIRSSSSQRGWTDFSSLWTSWTTLSGTSTLPVARECGTVYGCETTVTTFHCTCGLSYAAWADLAP